MSDWFTHIGRLHNSVIIPHPYLSIKRDPKERNRCRSELNLQVSLSLFSSERSKYESEKQTQQPPRPSLVHWGLQQCLHGVLLHPKDEPRGEEHDAHHSCDRQQEPSDPDQRRHRSQCPCRPPAGEGADQESQQPLCLIH